MLSKLALVHHLMVSTHHSTTLSSPFERTPAAPAVAVVDSPATRRLQDLVSVQPSWHCCFEIELVYWQAVYRHPTAQPTHYCAWGGYLRRLFGLGEFSQSLRLRALLANLESGVVPRLNGRRILLLCLVKVVRLLLVHRMLRAVLSQMHRLEG